MYDLKKKEFDTLPFYLPEELLKRHKILVCFSTRDGGQSKKKFASLNMAYHVGDNRSDIYQNRMKLLEALRLDKSLRINACNQIHGTDILIIEDKETAFSSKNADGIITDKKNTPIMVMGADCNLIIFADIKKKVIGSIHAGWKGTLKKILIHALEIFKAKYNSKEQDILIYFGPSIRGCCYEVTELFLKKFISKFGDGDYYVKGSHNEIRMDLAKLNKMQVLKYGIPLKNIIDSGKCTHCDENFFSYRRNKNTGRQAAIACIID
jgi:polyphenol oxidase